MIVASLTVMSPGSCNAFHSHLLDAAACLPIKQPIKFIFYGLQNSNKITTLDKRTNAIGWKPIPAENLRQYRATVLFLFSRPYIAMD